MWSGGRHSWAIIVVLVVMLVADAVLVSLAVAAVDRGTEASGPAPTYDLRTPSPTPTPTPTANDAEGPKGTPRILVAVDATTAWRAVPTSCADASAVIEKTTDGGGTWEPQPLTQEDVRQVLAIAAENDTLVSLVGLAGPQCSAGSFRSFTGGRFWEAAGAGAVVPSYVVPGDPATIQTSAGPIAAPCSPTSQVAGAASPAVLCDGVVQVRAGEAWLTLDVPGAVALAPSPTGFTVAVWGSPGCAGLELRAIVADASAATPLGCLAAETEPESVTLAQAGSAVWLWSGDRSYVSADGGVTW